VIIVGNCVGRIVTFWKQHLHINAADVEQIAARK